MIHLETPQNLEERSIGYLRWRIWYHMKRAYLCYTQYAKHEHIRIADIYAGEVAKRMNFHHDCIQ